MASACVGARLPSRRRPRRVRGHLRLFEQDDFVADELLRTVAAAVHAPRREDDGVVGRVLPLRLERLGPHHALHGDARHVLQPEHRVAVALLRVPHGEVRDHPGEAHARLGAAGREVRDRHAVQVLDPHGVVFERVARDVEADGRLLAREQLLVRPRRGVFERAVAFSRRAVAAHGGEAEHIDLPAVALAPPARAAGERLVHGRV